VRKVLVVGMLDSVHLARWLKQFRDVEIEISVFPSSKFRKLHPEVARLFAEKQVLFYKKCHKYKYRFLGYLDFLEYELLGGIFRVPRRAGVLRNLLQNTKLDIVHLIEIQHAGYLYLDARIDNKSFTLITTNYGSDLFYFKNFPNHKLKISELLKLSDFYSAECRRDYALAAEMGFSGTELPLMPNAGGFDISQMNTLSTPFKERSLIYVKGYGGIFGLGEIALQASSKILDRFPHINVVVVSLTSDLAKQEKSLKNRHGNRIEFHHISSPISQREVLGILRKSLVCIGASKSDGISTTFLEALVTGAIPVQTDTSCANEWTDKGFIAKIVGGSVDEIYEAVSEILVNPSSFDSASKSNMELSRKHLDSEKLSLAAQAFYEVEL
jgi:glycosyltransferase involved in cell wall biosynthesis